MNKFCVSGCSEQLHVERTAIGEVSGDDKNGGTSCKRRITIRPTAALYLTELLSKNV